MSATNPHSIPYPFSAIVGQESLKLALLLNALSPAVGGVLVRGEKGTAKSTAVRALAALLPPVTVVAGCPYACDPAAPNPGCPAGPHPPDAPVEERPVRLVELPVGASAERLSGTLDLERALTKGERAFEPGLLAAAHRGILYVDEVNLLPDHLVDGLLDVAAMGVNRVEREGVAVSHPSRFLLVGTMNPEEGELRPQLLDRFGLSVEVSGTPEVEERTEVVRRYLRYEADQDAFASAWREREREVAERVLKARRALPEVRLPEERLLEVSAVCASLGVDGLRGDLVTAKAARALAAWEGRAAVERPDVERAALLALAHRRRRGPLDEPGLTPEEVRASLPEEPPEDPDDPPDDSPDGGPDGAPERPEASGSDPSGEGNPEPGGESVGPGERSFAASGSFRAERFAVEGRGAAGPSGRRSRTVGERGHAVGSRPARRGETDLALAATLLAAAPRQSGRVPRGSGKALVLRPEDLRATVREGREGNLVVFCVDASGSMAARERMRAVKGAALELLLDAYRSRDRISLVAFRGAGARTLLPPTASADLAAARLRELPTGGRTPLAAGLGEAAGVIVSERRRDPSRRALLVVLTDGRATAGPDPREAARRLAGLGGVTPVVVDTESGNVRLGLAAGLSRELGGRCVRLEELSAAGVSGVVREMRNGRSAA
ncbi:von Willebrand factor type A domain [Rubrobacter radiotolerans]|uniref:Mg-protoporphyrin IX chelatase n=1 Tax=Rubrobacter radiotolerans TaxID=42256 RepID=A0A023X0X4_RUBRA|nr:VWA domain-containing protein [Rubrobacter radiotolerans]AHY46097.1 von Willebrand factor type A domain [Rubrobacter radiotolerans]MDX5893507.1 VWA domain-containing protein [Rubrobacter radiotolerans]SMC03876.1 magnesium chelatase subunit D [Rubrobacter radiotolerans DSM 5868]